MRIIMVAVVLLLIPSYGDTTPFKLPLWYCQSLYDWQKWMYENAPDKDRRIPDAEQNCWFQSWDIE